MYRNYLKRLIDCVIAICAMPFWLFIMLIIGPVIYFQDRGSIFYNAPRLGKDGKVFKMYKLRSMKLNAPDIRNEDQTEKFQEYQFDLSKIITLSLLMWDK